MLNMQQIGITIDTSEGLVDHVNGKKFTEQLGTFYIEDVNQKKDAIQKYSETYSDQESEFYRKCCF